MSRIRPVRPRMRRGWALLGVHLPKRRPQPRAAAFAAEVRRRLRRRVQRGTSIAMVPLRVRAGASPVGTRAAGDTRILVVAPRMVFNRLRTVALERMMGPVPSLARERAARGAAKHVREIHRERLVRRVRERHTRVEATSTHPYPARLARPANAPKTRQRPVVQPVERVVCRPSPAPAAAQPPSPPALAPAPESTLPAIVAAGARVSAAPAGALPPNLDVSRLADQVIETIDRRVLARRERLGRA